MRLPIWVAACALVALAAWSLVREESRRGGDGVGRLASQTPEIGVSPREAPRDVSQAPPPVPAGGEPGPETAQRSAARPPFEAAAAAQVEPDPAPVAVSGLLRSQSGTWPDLAGLLSGGVVVELFDTLDPGGVRRARLQAMPEPDGSTAIAFRFEGVRPGEHRLGVSSLVAEVWEPASLAVTAPAEGLVLWCRDRVDRVRLAFEVRDALDGAPIEAWEASALSQSVTGPDGVLLHAGPLELGAFAVDGRLEWSLAAPGYAPAFGDEREFQPAGEGVRVARVELRRGFAARVVVLARDPSMRPIEGACVDLDGRFAGLTDARGRLDLFHPKLPGELAVRWNGRQGRVAPVSAADSPEALRRGQMLVVVLE